MEKPISNKKIILSKSTLMRGFQCEKLLWLTFNKHDDSTEISVATQMQFDEGIAVGELARELEGKGVLIDNEYWDFSGAAKKTQEDIKNGEELIYEAAFLKDDLFFRADILKKTKSGWHLIEVKKSTDVKEEYIQDSAVQTLIMESSGIVLKTISLRHVNNKMVFPDFSNFFTTVDVTKEVSTILPIVKKQISNFKKIIKESKEPKKTIEAHCFAPYECPYKDYCWKNIPDFSIINLPGMRKEKVWGCFDRKIFKISDLDASKFNNTIKRAIEVTQSGNIFIDKKEIKAELDQWNWPLYFFDFETINPAIPKFKGDSPYIQIPFQFSCHVWKDKKTKKLEHFEFLHTENSDPRKKLIEAMLKSLGKQGSIVAYHKSFETTAIKNLAKFDKSNRDALLALVERFVDPLPIFRAHVYHQEFRGSFSIKNVAPALIGEKMNYDNLEIGDGGTAQSMALKVMFGKIALKEKEKIIKDLLIYCKQDTEAMVEIVKWLMKQ
jgi:hypothetical protein